MKLRLILHAHFLLCCLSGSSAFGQSFVVWKTQVWKIGPAGQIARLDFDFGGPGLEETLRGTTAPVVAPDQKRIAFTRENDLWVLDLATMTATKATSVGRPYTNRLASVFVLIASWSTDSRKVLYHVQNGETEDPDGSAPERKIREAPYGDHIYDLETKNSTPVSIPGEFLAWIPGGDFLVKTGQLKNSQLMRVHPGDTGGQFVPTEPGDYWQVRVAPDGSRIVLRRGSEIALIGLSDGKTSVLANGIWAEFQFPTFSPSGNHVAYVRQFPLSTRGWYGHELFVDGTRAYRSDKDFSYYWVNDDVLAILAFERDRSKNPSWILVDRTTNQEKLSRPMS